MTFDEFRSYCLAKPFATESFPFDQQTLVFKVDGKMFALADIDNFSGINLKADPERSMELREQFAGVRPGYHMNKKHWNTVTVYEDVGDNLIKELIDHSYSLVFSNLSKKRRDELALG